MTIDLLSLEEQARRHWETWLPMKTAELKENGEFEEALHGAAALAQKQALFLMQMRHYQEHEALEEALREFILLPPEPPDENDPLEMELAEREAEFQAMVREQETMEARWREEDDEEEFERQERSRAQWQAMRLTSGKKTTP